MPKMPYRWLLFISTLCLIFIIPLPAHSQDTPRIESDDTSVVREGEWVNQTAAQASGGSYLYNNGEAALALEFSGMSVEVIYVAGPGLGTLAIEIDGTVLRTVITTAEQTAYQQSAKIDYLSDEAHTVKVYAQAGGTIAVDAFRVALPPALTEPSATIAAIATIETADAHAIGPCANGLPIERVSPPQGGAPSLGADDFGDISANGRYVVFDSPLPGIVPEDTNNLYDIFVYDRQTCLFRRVSVDANGNAANAQSYDPHISASGRYIAFFSAATNLVPNDTNVWGDLFLYDQQTGQVSRINATADQQANNQTRQGDFSLDERFYVFSSAANNLVDNDTNLESDVFIRDLQTDNITLISRAPDGTSAIYGAHSPVVSADGRYIAFESSSINLTLDSPPDHMGQIYLHDRELNQTTLVYDRRMGAIPDEFTDSAAISADGRYIVFASEANNIVPNDDNQLWDVFLYDAQLGHVSRISVSLTNGATDNHSGPAHISPNGRYIVYGSHARNITPNQPDFGLQFADVFLFDRWTNVTTLVSVTTTNEPVLGGSWPAELTDEGEVLFVSQSNILVPNDTNNVEDLFVAQPIRTDTIGFLRSFESTQPTPYALVSWIHTLQSWPVTTLYQNEVLLPPLAGPPLWVTGDWDGDGERTPGYLHAGTFTYTNSRTRNGTWSSLWIGLDARPVAGRFQTNPTHDCIGAVHSAPLPPHGTGYSLYFTCDLTPNTSPTLTAQWLGVLLPDSAGFSGVAQFAAGDFNRNGIDTIAIRRGVYIAWTNINPAQGHAQFNNAQYFAPAAAGNSQFLVGDWNRDNNDSFGLFFDSGVFYWRNDMEWNSGAQWMQGTGLPLGTPVTAVSWR